MTTPERKDTLLRMAVELAGEFDMSGVELLDAVKAEMTKPDLPKHYSTDLFYEFYDREIEDLDYAAFASLMRSLIEHAGNWDEDLYND